MGRSHDVEEEVDVGLVETGEAVEHNDLGVGLVRLGVEALLERLLLLDGGEEGLVVVVGQDAPAVVVEDGQALDGVEGRRLKQTRQ